MTGLVGIYSRDRVSDINPELEKMLNAIEHRGTIYRQRFKKPSGLVTVSARSTSAQDTQILPTEHGIIMIQGECLNLLKDEDIKTLVSKIEPQPERVYRLVFLSGVVAVSFGPAGLKLYRSEGDSLPLYYADSDKGFYFATERKALWTIGISKITTLDPGTIFRIPRDGGRIGIEPAAQGQPPVIAGITGKEALSALKHALELAFERIKCHKKSGVLFSGGVDSSLAALMTRKYCEKTILLTTCASNSHDATAAQTAARMLKMELITVDLTAETVWEVLPSLIYSIERSGRMDVEIAIPFFLAAEKASELGCTLVVSGQGPDDLFAGYARHARICNDEGIEALEEALVKDVSMTHAANIERDERAVAHHGLNTAFPYLDPRFSRLALSIPAGYKIELDEKPTRKRIFRELAEQLGLHSEIAWAQKRATQFSSGSSKILLQTTRRFADGCTGLTKRELDSQVQIVLDEIAIEVGVPEAE